MGWVGGLGWVFSRVEVVLQLELVQEAGTRPDPPMKQEAVPKATAVRSPEWRMFYLMSGSWCSALDREQSLWGDKVCGGGGQSGDILPRLPIPHYH